MNLGGENLGIHADLGLRKRADHETAESLTSIAFEGADLGQIVAPDPPTAFTECEGPSAVPAVGHRDVLEEEIVLDRDRDQGNRFREVSIEFAEIQSDHDVSAGRWTVKHERFSFSAGEGDIDGVNAFDHPNVLLGLRDPIASPVLLHFGFRLPTASATAGHDVVVDARCIPLLLEEAGDLSFLLRLDEDRARLPAVGNLVPRPAKALQRDQFLLDSYRDGSHGGSCRVLRHEKETHGQNDGDRTDQQPGRRSKLAESTREMIDRISKSLNHGGGLHANRRVPRAFRSSAPHSSS